MADGGGADEQSDPDALVQFLAWAEERQADYAADRAAWRVEYLAWLAARELPPRRRT